MYLLLQLRKFLVIWKTKKKKVSGQHDKDFVPKNPLGIKELLFLNQTWYYCTTLFYNERRKTFIFFCRHTISEDICFRTQVNTQYRFQGIRYIFCFKKLLTTKEQVFYTSATCSQNNSQIYVCADHINNTALSTQLKYFHVIATWSTIVLREIL